MNGYAKVIAKRRPAFGGVGQDINREAGHVASHYLHARRVRGLSAMAALEAARNLPATYVQGREYYGMSGKAGAMDDNGLRWIESTVANGLRFIGDAADILPGHRTPTGYYTDAHGDYSTLRAGVWQLPGKGRHARLVAGYREFDGKSETNAGSARIDCRTIWLADMSDAFGNVDEHDETLDAARAADSIAESAAESEREYNEAYERGRKAAEIDGELIAARREALPLIRELKAALRVPMARDAFPAACKALRERIDSLIATIDEKREARESAWGNVWRGADLEPWLAGFIDESDFVRAVRLGYASKADWHGKPDECPI